MQGKTCVVTGATSGIGHAVAKGLVGMGADVIIISRDTQRIERAVAELRALPGAAKVEGFAANLAHIKEVQLLGENLSRHLTRLDVLLNVAGGHFGKRLLSPDGYEMTFALDHIGYFVLTNALLPLLKRSAPARIVSVSSGAQSIGKIAWDDIMMSAKYSPTRAYCQAKLANVMHTRSLARLLSRDGITANCLHPGVVRTNFAAEYGDFFTKLLIRAASPFLLTPEQGADTAIYLATNPEVAGVTGQYFIKRKSAKVNALALDDNACDRLWTLTEKLVADALGKNAGV